jgi:hypothetical protein
MKIVACLLALTALASAEPKKELAKTDVARWEKFPGPQAAPAVTEKEAFVVSPIQSSTWDRLAVSFVLAPIVEAKPNALVVQGPFHRFEVPGAFVGPALVPAKVAVGAYVLFQQNPTMTMSLAVGRVTKAGKDSYTIKYDWGGNIDDAEDVPATHVLPLDGKVHFGEPVSFELDGQRVLAWYIGPGHEEGASWVVSVGKLVEHRDLKPLTIAAFKKGAKVLAQVRTDSVLKAGVPQEPRQPLEKATVVDVRDGGLAYKIRIDEGDDKGEMHDASPDEVFAR